MYIYTEENKILKSKKLHSITDLTLMFSVKLYVFKDRRVTVPELNKKRNQKKTDSFKEFTWEFNKCIFRLCMRDKSSFLDLLWTLNLRL